MDAVIDLTVLIAVAAAVYWAVRPKPLFFLQVRAGRVRVVSGTVTQACVDQAESICGMHGIASGSISGFRTRSGRIRLTVSREFPPEALQQLRNWWAEFGWNAPSGDRPPPRRATACR